MECQSLHPDDFMRMSKGKLVDAYVAYLSGVQLVPLARLVDILADLFEARVSQVALPVMIRRIAEKLRDPANTIRKALPKPT